MQAFLRISLGALFLASFSAAQDKPGIHLDTGSEQMLGSADKSFAMDAAQGGLAEIQFGKLAAQKAANPELKEFGRQMTSDHTRLNEKLKALVAREHMTLPEAIAAKDQATYDMLSRLSGSAFDKACAEEMLKAHQIAVKEFTREAKAGKDSNMRNFASDALLLLQQHLDKIRSIHLQIRTS